MMSGGSAGLLLSAVAGYWVLERAEHHKGRLKGFGQLLGAVIIIVSLVGVACLVYCGASGACSMMRGHGMKGMCPINMPSSGMGGMGSSTSP